MSTEASRRGLILEAATRLLRHYGPGKTTIADIAREAAVGVGTVYLEFDSKEAIVEELSRSQYARVLLAMRDAARSPRANYEARLKATFHAKVTMLLAMADEGVHAPELVHCTRPAVQQAQSTFRDEELQLVAALLRDAHEAGEFCATEPIAVAATLLRAYASFAPPWLFAMPRAEVVRNLTAMHDLVCRGLVNRGAAGSVRKKA